jgi:hypothetical protein
MTGLFLESMLETQAKGSNLNYIRSKLMSEEIRNKIDQSWSGMYKTGGICLLAAGVVVFIFLFFVISLRQTMPMPVMDVLQNPVPSTGLFLLTALGELLLLPAGLGLYLSLKELDKNAALFATALWVLVTPLFLASRGLILSLYEISSGYLGTADEVMQAAYLASAELAIETQSIYAYMALICLSAASIIFGLVMLKGIYGRLFGYLVIAAGILTLATPVGVIIEIPFIISFTGVVLGAAWQIIGGIKLYKLGLIHR